MKRTITGATAPQSNRPGPVTRSQDEGAKPRVMYHHMLGPNPKRRRTTARRPPGDAPDAASDTSGPVGAGRVQLRMRRPPRETSPVLAYDRTPPPGGGFSFYRSSADLGRLDASHDLTGLAELRFSASEGFSTLAQFRELARLARLAGGTRLRVLNVCLSSALIADDYPVTLRGQRDWANQGLSHDEAVAHEAVTVAEVRGIEELKLTRAFDLRKGVVPPKTVMLTRPVITTEQDLVEAAGGIPERLTITNHLRPERAEVDRFIDLVHGMEASDWLHVHCIGGRGRTTTVSTMLDMLRNAHQVSAENIIRRQERLAYDYSLTTAKADKPYKRGFSEDRYAFLLEFHAYAEANPGGRPLRWSEWRRSDLA